VISSAGADINRETTLPLRNIPLGTTIHNVELKVEGRAQMVRSAGSGRSSWPRKGSGSGALASGEVRLFTLIAGHGRATGHVEHNSVHNGKAGRTAGWGGVRTTAAHHESRRSPDGWWRRPVVRWSPSLFALGPAQQGAQDPPNKRTDRMIIKRRGKKA